MSRDCVCVCRCVVIERVMKRREFGWWWWGGGSCHLPFLFSYARHARREPVEQTMNDVVVVVVVDKQLTATSSAPLFYIFGVAVRGVCVYPSVNETRRANSRSSFRFLFFLIFFFS